ncbi:MAG: hypothetical protein ACR2JT_00865 [Nocardioidaceae bacterium]
MAERIHHGDGQGVEMTVGVEDDRSLGPPRRLPEPAVRVGAYSYTGKRVRDEVREGAAVVVFSLVVSTGFALVMTLCIRLAG